MDRGDFDPPKPADGCDGSPWCTCWDCDVIIRHARRKEEQAGAEIHTLPVERAEACNLPAAG